MNSIANTIAEIKSAKEDLKASKIARRKAEVMKLEEDAEDLKNQTGGRGPVLHQLNITRMTLTEESFIALRGGSIPLQATEVAPGKEIGVLGLKETEL